MIAPELQDYINSSKASGMTEEQIRQALVVQGWTAEQIGEAFSTAPISSVATPISAYTAMGMGNTLKVVLIAAGILVVGGVLVAGTLHEFGSNNLKETGNSSDSVADTDSLNAKDSLEDVMGISAPCAANDKLVSDTNGSSISDPGSSVTTRGKVKTYKNTPYGLSFDFPCSWDVRSDYIESNTVLNIYVQPQSPECHAELFVSGNSPKLPTFQTLPGDTLSEVVINGNKYTKFLDTHNGTGSSYLVHYYLINKGKLYMYSFGEDINIEAQECEKQIMKNVKVI